MLSLLKLQTDKSPEGNLDLIRSDFLFSGDVLVCGLVIFFAVLQDVTQLFDKIRHYYFIM